MGVPANATQLRKIPPMLSGTAKLEIQIPLGITAWTALVGSDLESRHSASADRALAAW